MSGLETIKTIIATHENPHIDEAVGILLCIKYGDKINCKPVEVSFLGESIFSPEPNTIYLGIGGGAFNEHVYDASKGKKTSSVMLLAEAMGITKDPKYRNIMELVNYAHHNDIKGSTNTTELGRIMKNKFALNQSDEEVWKWVYEVLCKKLESLENQEQYKDIAKKMRGNVFSKDALWKHISSFEAIDLSHKRRIVLRNEFAIQDVIAVYMIKHYSKLNNLNFKTQIYFTSEDGYEFNQKDSDLCIGFGNGHFAELPALKMQKQFNVKPDREFKLILDYVSNIHSRQGYHPYELAGLLVDRNVVKDTSPYDNFIWALSELKLLTLKQRNYLSSLSDFHTGLKNKKYSQYYVGTRKFVVIFSDNFDLVNVAMSKDGYEHDLVILRRSNGHTSIFTKGKKLPMAGVTYKLRNAEMKKRGLNYLGDFQSLFQEGALVSVPQWFYHKNTESIFNGAKTHSKIEPTLIPLKEIIEIVRTNFVKNKVKKTV